MATTTNYGWTTPDDTALVKDGAAAIRTLGSSVDTTTKNLNPSTSLGDIEYRSSTANTNTRLGIGSTGDVLTVAGGVPTWAAPAAGGKVLQVVQGIKTGTATTSSTSFSDTGITATITPSSTNSKILAFVNVNNCRKAGGNNNSGIRMILLRGATTIYNMGSIIAYTNTTGQNDCGSIDGVYLDSPATTSATTYKVQFASNVAATSIDINNYNAVDDTQSSITLLEIGA
jgi:hypothetical protein